MAVGVLQCYIKQTQIRTHISFLDTRTHGAHSRTHIRSVSLCVQVRLSIAQMDTYDDHGAAAAELDEDFFDNFS